VARTRNLKPSFFSNDLLAECEPMARLLFAGLWTLADREGRMEYRPRRIKGLLFPFENVEVEPLMEQLADRGFVVVYRVECRDFLAIPTFGEHQRCHPDERCEGFPGPESGVEISVFPERNEKPGNPPARAPDFPASCALPSSIPSSIPSSCPPTGTKRSRSVETTNSITWSADAGWQGISEEQRGRWATAYPAADLPVELARAHDWLVANPAKAVRSRWSRFLVGWLTRCQDRGGTHRANGTPVAPRVVRTARLDLGGQVMSDEEYAREKRRLAQQARLRAEREAARRNRSGSSDGTASLGETLRMNGRVPGRARA
jgi:hypothetical protein